MSATGRGRPLTSLKGFIDRVESQAATKEEYFFYRGHSNRSTYRIEPSIMRNNKTLEAEHHLFRELIATNPAEFKDDNSTLERLARMQHHSCPTRLLDLSSNPLVALYFSTKSNPDAHGEVILFKVQKSHVRFYDSDTVSCIANLARLSFEDKEVLRTISDDEFEGCGAVKKLVHQIREEKPYFESGIHREDLSKIVVVRTKQSSKRILAQSGAFMIFGLVGLDENNPVPGVIIERITIDKESKKKISRSLDALSINDASLFMDIDSSARYIKNRYSL